MQILQSRKEPTLMSSKTKIVVFKMKELVYTAIFLLLGIVLLILLYCMFFSKDEISNLDAQENVYIPGVYTSSIVLGTRALDVEVTVNTTQISSIRLVNLDEAVTTMYPLMERAIDNIALQMIYGQSVDSVTYTDDTKYTSQILLDAVDEALERAKIEK